MKVATSVVAMFIASVLPAAAQTPIINTVVSQATFTAPASPGMPVLINGTNLAAARADCPGPKVPLTCGSVTVSVSGRAVPVRIVAPTQVLSYIPVDPPVGQAIIIVKNHQGLSSSAFTVAVDQYAPGIQCF